MISKNDLVLFLLLLDELIQNNGFTEQELINEEQKSKITLLIEKHFGDIDNAEGTQLLRELFEEYIRRLNVWNLKNTSTLRDLEQAKSME